jgi:hypothetical protein
MSSKLYYSLPCFGLLTAVLAGCADNSTPVKIDFHQIGFCNTYTTPGGARASKPNEVFVVYKIEAIDNAKRSADFNFVPTRLYVDPGEWGAKQTGWQSRPGDAQDLWYRRDRRRYVSSDTAFARAMGVRALAPSVISHAEKKEIMGYSIIEVPMPSGGQPLEKTAVTLSYDPQVGEEGTPVDPPVVLNSTNAAQPSWPHPADCNELALDRLPA